MSIPFVKTFDFDYGVATQLSPLVQRVIADNPGPFTYTGTGVFIIGTDSVCVIDPGPTTPDHMAAIDRALEGRTVSHVLVTHHHIDHRILRENQILDALGSGLDTIGEIVKRLYKDVDKRLHPAAAHSVLSHMIHLRETGRVQAEGLDGLRQSYQLA